MSGIPQCELRSRSNLVRPYFVAVAAKLAQQSWIGLIKDYLRKEENAEKIIIILLTSLDVTKAVTCAAGRSRRRRPGSHTHTQQQQSPPTAPYPRTTNDSIMDNCEFIVVLEPLPRLASAEHAFRVRRDTVGSVSTAPGGTSL